MYEFNQLHDGNIVIFKADAIAVYSQENNIIVTQDDGDENESMVIFNYSHAKLIIKAIRDCENQIKQEAKK